MREYVRVQTGILLGGVAFQVNRTARTGDAEAIHDLRVAVRRLSRRIATRKSWIATASPVRAVRFTWDARRRSRTRV